MAVGAEQDQFWVLLQPGGGRCCLARRAGAADLRRLFRQAICRGEAARGDEATDVRIRFQPAAWRAEVSAATELRVLRPAIYVRTRPKDHFPGAHRDRENLAYIYTADLTNPVKMESTSKHIHIYILGFVRLVSMVGFWSGSQCAITDLTHFGASPVWLGRTKRMVFFLSPEKTFLHMLWISVDYEVADVKAVRVLSNRAGSVTTSQKGRSGGGDMYE